MQGSMLSVSIAVRVDTAPNVCRRAEAEGRSLGWGVRKVLIDAGKVPDVIYDEGGWGKEPMIRILGKDPAEVAGQVIKIKRRCHDSDATR